MRPWQHLLLVAAAGGLVVAATPADDQPQFEDAGWWWRAQDGPVELPAPENVPEGGLMIQGVLGDEAGAVAAVRFSGADGATRLVLEMTDEDLAADEVAAIVACPAVDSWTGGDEPGRWEERPEADCDAGEVQGVRDGATATWRFDVGLLVDGDALDVVLQPGGEPQEPEEFEGEALLPSLGDLEGAPAPPFAVTFDAPRDDNLEATGAATGDDFDVPDPEEAIDTPDPGDADAPADDQLDDGPDGAPEAGMELDEAPRPEAGDAAGDAPQDAEAPQVADQPEEQAGSPPPTELRDQQPAPELAAGPASFSQDPVRQVAALVAALSLLAAAAPWGMGAAGARGGVLTQLRRSQLVRPDVAAATLGAAQAAGPEAEPRGVGRFARPRTEDPPAL